ncbi:MAG TPA: VOC family protein [Gaiellaceae bacterium]|jgi:catechol 2,3-dioxygenase|nr:VOC family protein [Gaiellaceae bacterium]
MGAVHLTVSDLGRSVAYYEQLIGLRVHGRDGAVARLGTDGEDLLVLIEQKGATPADGFAGLFHFALLVPERVDLARWLGHAARVRVPLSGLSDHAVSEAIYLRDPDGHGIEIYADRPRKQWSGRVAELMTTVPLDVNDLLALDDREFTQLPEGTTMGHVHLRVTDVEPAVEFYESLGLELTARYGAEAAFLSYGGYHHHVGVNTWESAGAPYAPDDRARLTRVTLRGAPGERDLVDPSGIPVHLATGA